MRDNLIGKDAVGGLLQHLVSNDLVVMVRGGVLAVDEPPTNEGSDLPLQSGRSLERHCLIIV
ncbi:hypothetical protein D3C87_2000180 [compost metagenome]